MGKKGKKIFHKNNQKKFNKSQELKEYIKGFLIMSDKNKEKLAVNEAYDILNTELEKLYPELFENDDMLKRKIFFNFDTNCNGVIFVKIEKSLCEKIDVYKIISNIFNKIQTEKVLISKNITKIFPIEVATLYSLDFITENIKYIINKRFGSLEDIKDKITIDFEVRFRNNSKVKKEEVVDKILNGIDFDKFSIEYNNPMCTVFVDITCELMCLSIIDRYHEYKGYNIHLIGKTQDEIKYYLSVGDKVIVNKKNEDEEVDDESVNII